MRWADMDLLGHVNNVTYVDYLAEARRALFAGLPAAEATVSRHRVEFRAPLVFRRRPVLVDTWVTGVEPQEVGLAHEIYDEGEHGRTTYLRAATTLAHHPTEADSAVLDLHRGAAEEWRALPTRPRPRRTSTYPAAVRRSDTDEHHRVRDVAHFELLQEARIKFLMGLHTRGQQWSQHVVARTDVDYLAPVPLRQAPYEVHSWVGHLGTRSFTVQAELCDDDRVLARAAVVMVTFDSQTQRPADMAETQRARLEEELAS